MFFVRFLHNHSVLLVNPEVLCEAMELYFVRKKLEKSCVEIKKYLKNMSMIILNMSYKM